MVERETNIDQSVMERLISGNDLDVQNVEAIVRVLARTYPVPLKVRLWLREGGGGARA